MRKVVICITPYYTEFLNWIQVNAFKYIPSMATQYSFTYFSTEFIFVPNSTVLKGRIFPSHLEVVKLPLAEDIEETELENIYRVVRLLTPNKKCSGNCSKCHLNKKGEFDENT